MGKYVFSVLCFFIVPWVFLSSCAKFDRNNPFDPDSTVLLPVFSADFSGIPNFQPPSAPWVKVSPATVDNYVVQIGDNHQEVLYFTAGAASHYSQSYVDLPRIGSRFKLEFDFRVDNSLNNYNVLLKIGNPMDLSSYYEIGLGNVTFGSQMYEQIAGTPTAIGFIPKINAWYHVVIVVDRILKTYTGYVVDENKQAVVFAEKKAWPIVSFPDNPRLHCYVQVTGAFCSSTASFDNIKIYNVVD